MMSRDVTRFVRAWAILLPCLVACGGAASSDLFGGSSAGGGGSSGASSGGDGNGSGKGSGTGSGNGNGTGTGHSDGGSIGQSGDASASGDGANPSTDAASDGSVGKPTCTMNVTPGFGTVFDTFQATWGTENAGGCTVRLDGASYSTDCAGGASFRGADLGIGDHKLTIDVINESGFTANCFSTWTVTPSAGAPVCNVGVTPTAGTVSTKYTASLTSQQATACSYSVDGSASLPVPCDGDFTLHGNTFGPGTHNVTVSAKDDQGVTGSCTANWTETP